MATDAGSSTPGIISESQQTSSVEHRLTLTNPSHPAGKPICNDYGETSRSAEIRRSELGGELEEDDDRTVPKLYPEFCTTKVLTTELGTGKSIVELLPPDEGGEDAEDAVSGSRPNAELARCLSLAWLRQTLLEGLCWEGSIAENLLFRHILFI